MARIFKPRVFKEASHAEFESRDIFLDFEGLFFEELNFKIHIFWLSYTYLYSFKYFDSNKDKFFS